MHFSLIPLPGNLEELSVGVLVEDGAELGVARRQQHGGQLLDRWSQIFQSKCSI